MVCKTADECDQNAGALCATYPGPPDYPTLPVTLNCERTLHGKFMRIRQQIANGYLTLNAIFLFIRTNNCLTLLSSRPVNDQDLKQHRVWAFFLYYCLQPIIQWHVYCFGYASDEILLRLIYILQLVSSAWMAVLKYRPVLHYCVFIFFWSSWITKINILCCLGWR